jgi:hypothetical protein
MSRTSVFLLGAGASKAAGAPLMAEFLTAAKNLRRFGLATEYHKSFDLVFKAMAALQAIHSKSTLDFNNVESLFSAFEVAKTLDKLPGFESEAIDEIIDSLKTVIVVTLEQTIKFPCNGTSIHAPLPYEPFAELVKTLLRKVVPSHQVAILTFNYDICIDYALYQRDFQVHYGLDGKLGDGASVPLLKLHGSLNWTENEATKEIIPWNLEDYFRARGRVHAFDHTTELSLPIGSQLSHFKPKNVPITGTPVIVAPTFNKGDSHRTLSKVWKAAAEALGTAENIFIIGYSFPETDKFFEYLYALGTQGPTLFERVWLFNPDSTGLVLPRFAKLLGSGATNAFRHWKATFKEAIEVISQEFPRRA